MVQSSMIQFFFTDRLWIVKAAAALGLLAWLFTTSHRQLSDINPPTEKFALCPESMRGKMFHLTGYRVHGREPEGFSINTEVGPVLLRTSTPPPVGAYVTFNARAVAPRILE